MSLGTCDVRGDTCAVTVSGQLEGQIFVIGGIGFPRLWNRANLNLSKDFYTMKKAMSFLIAAFMLGSCAVYTPSGSVVVGPYDDGHRGGFCPPGQAKKGNC
mgnify:CR=1 FL=1